MPNTTTTNGTQDLAAECKTLENRCAELTRERDQLKAELAKAQCERDQYLKTVYYFMRKECPPPTFTKEEVFAAVQNEQSFGDLIDELTQKYGKEK